MVAVSEAVSLSPVLLFMLVGKNFLPVDDRSEYSVSVKAPEGTSLAATMTIAERIARELREQPEVVATLTSIGTNTGSGFAAVGTSLAPNPATIDPHLKDVGDRNVSQANMIV